MIPDDLYDDMMKNDELWFVYKRGWAYPICDAPMMDV